MSMLQIKENNLNKITDLESEINLDLQLIKKYSIALNDWKSANDEFQLINSVNKLVKYNLNQLDNFKFIEAVPSTYWLTLLFERIANQFDNNDLKVYYPDSQIDPTLRFSSLTNQEFYFVESRREAGGFELRVASYNLPILFIDLQDKLLYLHPDNLAKLFVEHVGSQQSLSQQSQFENTLRQIANVFAHTGFQTDINILEKNVQVNNKKIQANFFDDLFLKFSDQKNKVKTSENGISIHFDDQVIVNLQQVNNSDFWEFTIDDIANKYSLLTVLEHFDSFGQWYLKELNQVGLKYHPEFFAD